MTIKKLFVILFAAFIVLGCQRTKERNNSHTPSPARFEGFQAKDSQRNSLYKRLQSLFAKEASVYSDVQSIFVEEITSQFIYSVGIERDPVKEKTLREFHLLILTRYESDTEDRGNYQDLAHQYYLLLREICVGHFNDCSLLRAFNSMPHIASVLDLAKTLVSAADKRNYEVLVANVGRPFNNLDVLTQELERQLREQIERDDVEVDAIEGIVNRVIYLEAQGHKIDISDLEKLLQKYQWENIPSEVKHSFDKLLAFLERQGSSLEITQSFVQNMVLRSDYYRTLYAGSQGTLYRWFGNTYETENLKDDFEIHFSILGLLDATYSGDLHNRIVEKVFARENGRKSFLMLVEYYLQKNFVTLVYRSHEILGSLFQDQLRMEPRVHQFIERYARAGDTEMSLVWNNGFEKEVIRIEKYLVGHFSRDELKIVTNLKNNLHQNIRETVVYPALFVSGYHATLQSNASYNVYDARPSGGEVESEMDDSIYFQRLFDGQNDVYFKFVDVGKAGDQRTLYSALVSMDPHILRAHGLDYDFIKPFMRRLVRGDQENLNKARDWLTGLFSPQALAMELQNYCDRINVGDFDFSYNHLFGIADSKFFFGPVGANGFGGPSGGTSESMTQYVRSMFPIKNVDQPAEKFVRMQLGTGKKVKRMRLYARALSLHGHEELSDWVEQKADELLQDSRELVEEIGSRIWQIAACAYTLGSIEDKMRLYYIKREISFVRSTYRVLKLLNSYRDDEIPDISTIRAQHPDLFESEYIRDLPSSGDFVEEANKSWETLTRPFASQVSDYYQKTREQLGFRRDRRGKFVYHSNQFETRFRRLAFILDPSVSGKEFPRAQVLEIPQTNTDLALSLNRNEKGSDFFIWDLEDQSWSEEKFIYQIFSSMETDNKMLWRGKDVGAVFRNIFMNIAAFSKAKVSLALEDDYEYGTYSTQAKGLLKQTFEKMADLTNKFLDLLNISDDEKEVLQVMRRYTFTSNINVNQAEKLFLGKDNRSNTFQDLGFFDLYFMTLASYRLGDSPLWRDGLFGAKYGENPLLMDWSQRRSDEGGKNQKKHLQHRDIYYYAVSNANDVKYWSRNILLDPGEDLLTLVHHDLYHPAFIEHAVVDAFLAWLKSPQLKKLEMAPYRFDLFHYRQPKIDQAFLTPSIEDRYWDSRNEFHEETGYLFDTMEASP